jgi:hypothetical protein
MYQFGSDLFTYSKCRFVAEASDLGIGPGEVVRQFEIKSSQTSAVVQFELDERVVDAEGDVTHWIYSSRGADQFGNDWDKLFTTTIFND